MTEQGEMETLWCLTITEALGFIVALLGISIT